MTREQRKEIRELLRRLEELLEATAEEEATVEEEATAEEEVTEEEEATVEEEATEEELIYTITSYLRKWGISAHIKGYHYIREAVMLCLKEPDYLGSITKWLYPEIAQRYDTTPSRVERAIRHAIERAWNVGNIEELNEVFQYTIEPNKGKPTNAQFISVLVEEIRMK
ncbi:MAG: sporulation transcription factor Spo0A [Clostridia bacterium]|nr:sporulation transcription factor Spo0A [Clostridia bacterium]